MSNGNIRDTDTDWNVVAEQNPYWGVLSEDAYKGQSISGDLKTSFFASGSRQVGDWFGFIKATHAPDFRPDRSLDYGCGVGRLLIPIAQNSGEAVGVDIAPDMIKLCQSHIQDFGVANASVVLADDGLSRVHGDFDFINSYIVLQHIPPERGFPLIWRLLSRLKVGGVASLQVTYAKAQKYVDYDTAWAGYYRRDGNSIRELGWVPRVPQPGTITMYDYDLNTLVALVSQIGGNHISVLPTNDDGHLGVHLIFSRVR